MRSMLIFSEIIDITLMEQPQKTFSDKEFFVNTIVIITSESKIIKIEAVILPTKRLQVVITIKSPKIHKYFLIPQYLMLRQ